MSKNIKLEIVTDNKEKGKEKFIKKESLEEKVLLEISKSTLDKLLRAIIKTNASKGEW